jgi:hypothetical protein
MPVAGPGTFLVSPFQVTRLAQLAQVYNSSYYCERPRWLY